MLKDAALLLCDLNLTLASFGLSTQDAHCWNIIFDGSVPKFVDFGSIVPGKADIGQQRIWYKEFRDFFLYPLYLMSDGQGESTRRLLFDLNNNVSKQSIIKLLPRIKQLQCQITDLSNNSSVFRSREKFLQQLRDSVENIKFPRRKTTWSGYYDSEFPLFEPSETWNLKHQTVFEIFKKLHPKSVIDVGSNRGWYSQLAASMDIPVVAFDADEICVRSLYADVSKNKMPVLPLVMNICKPSPSCIGVEYNEYHPSAQDRLKGELVLALAIVHHLVFKQGLRFDSIIERLAGFTTKWLLVEFVPPDDRYLNEWYSDEFNWYSIQNFVAEIEKIFPRVEILDSYPSPRKLLLCERSVN